MRYLAVAVCSPLMFAACDDDNGNDGPTYAITLDPLGRSDITPITLNWNDLADDEGRWETCLEPGTTLDWVLTVMWWLVSGSGTVTFVDEHAAETGAVFTGPGVHVLRLTADGGELQASDEPTITIISPQAGDVWYVGTSPRIRWTTVIVDDVHIDYSTDGGATWNDIAASINTSSAKWGSYPWTVPDEPSTNCVVLIVGYFGDCPTQSGGFEIRRVTDSDSDGMDDDWERQHFGDLSHDGTSDSDGDGTSDYQEFMRGTNPLVPDAAGTDDDDSDALSCAAGSAKASSPMTLLMLAAAVAAVSCASCRGESGPCKRGTQRTGLLTAIRRTRNVCTGALLHRQRVEGAKSKAEMSSSGGLRPVDADVDDGKVPAATVASPNDLNVRLGCEPARKYSRER